MGAKSRALARAERRQATGSQRRADSGRERGAADLSDHARGRRNNDAEIEEFRERVKAYLIKASREAKTYTTWTEPSDVYEDALLSFVDAIFNPDDSGEFLADFKELQEIVSRAGACNSVSQTLLKLTVPGVPDMYQGTDLWDFSLVDPDNRRPVDYERRMSSLHRFDDLSGSWLEDLLSNWRDGQIKLLVAQRALQLRQEKPGLFNEGSYCPCEVRGPKAKHVIAFARIGDGDGALIVGLA